MSETDNKRKDLIPSTSNSGRNQWVKRIWRCVTIACLLSISSVLWAAEVVEEYETSGASQFVVPPFVTGITVEAWGAGGRGGDTSGFNQQAGGGGGGAYARSELDVTPGASIPYVVGAGSNASDDDGQDSTFGSAPLVIAAGGETVNGVNNTSGADGGSVANSSGDTTRPGGAGADRVTGGGTPRSGGGGSSAAPGGGGADANSAQGATAPSGGGDGGDAGGAQGVGEDGDPGTQPGGGGGGGRTTNSFFCIFITCQSEGGAGADGRITVTYFRPQLEFEQQPSTTEVDQSIDPPVVVRALDASGEVVEAFDGDVTLAIDAGPLGASLSGTVPVTAVDGVATFADLSIDTVGADYTLEATADDVESVVSQPFDVSDAPPAPILDYRMDELVWSDPNSVADSAGNGRNGTPIDDAAPDNAHPAIATNPGTCGYGTFNGSDDGIEDGDAAAYLNGLSAVTVTAWVYNTASINGNDRGIFFTGDTSPGKDHRLGIRYDEAGINGGDDNVLKAGVQTTQCSNSDDCVQVETEPGVMAVNDWQHIAMTWESGGDLRVYVDGIDVTGDGTGDIGQGTGGQLDAVNGLRIAQGGKGQRWQGRLDEFRIYDEALSQSDVQRVSQETHPCPENDVDRYAVLAPAKGLTCEALPVTIESRDASGTPVEPAGGTTIDVSAVVPGSTNAAPDTTWAGTDSDQTTYTFGGNESSVTLQLRRTSAGSVNVNVDDGSATEITSADPDIPFAETGFLFYAGGSANAIGNQIAGKPSNVAPNSQSISVRAVEDPNGPTPGAACEARFSDDQTIEMAFECTDPATCSGSRQVAVNGTGIPGNDDGSVADFGNVTLDFGANGSAPLDLVYTDAGEIRLHARDDLPASGDDPAVTLTGTSNRYVVRPFGFHVAAAGNPAAATAGGDVYRSAGTDFDIQVAAVGWNTGDDTDNDGVPDGYDNGDPTDNANLGDNVVLPNFGPESSDESATATSSLWRPDGGNDPALEGTQTIDEGAFEDSGDVGAGSAGTTVRYPEVGIIELRAALADGDYMGTGFDVPGRSVAVGRFIPEDFDQIATDGIFRDTCVSASNMFTYLGKTFGYTTGGEPELTITARNVQGQTTRNYTADFAKLVAGDVERTGPTTDNEQDGRDGTVLEVDPTLSTGTLTDNGDGTLTYTFSAGDDYHYLRNLDRDGDGENDAIVAPFDSDLTITIDAIVDSDDVAAEDGNRDDVTPASVHLRFGRLVIDNAAGAEIAPVEQVIRAEYFEVADGDQWTVNADDDGCTAFALTTPGHEIALSNDDDGASPVSGDTAIEVADGETSIVETGPVPLDGGEAILTFSAPGAGNTGWVDTIARLGVEHPYLAIDDDGDGIWNADPTGRLTFGIYTGPSGRILLREIPAN